MQALIRFYLIYW